MSVLCVLFGHDIVQVDNLPLFLVGKCGRCDLSYDLREDFETHCKRELGED
jgi:hypothetical protein